ncbi:MAG: helix-turn-helix domain-containing protein [Lachnospiraceae bacterium]|nr:helix-turn-helix domain-containing protein [Lachnospiraceae bacterium]
MQQLQILMRALEYIEQNLGNPAKTEEIADYCYCSKSSLEKIFRCLNNISIHDYIVRRKMSLAGRRLLENADVTVLDVALEFGFSGNEAFTRAFKQVWNMTPSEFRKKKCTAILFPQYIGYTTDAKGEDDSMKRKNVDISELYDLFVERRKCYFICTDIKGLLGFNDIARKAGDLAIIEALLRMEKAAGEEDYVFRIGADEFVMMTNSQDLDYANEIKEKILACNGNAFVYENQELPLELYVSVVKLDGNEMRYKELFDTLHTRILESKNI